jgi:hypothetical protein
MGFRKWQRSSPEAVRTSAVEANPALLAARADGRS